MSLASEGWDATACHVLQKLRKPRAVSPLRVPVYHHMWDLKGLKKKKKKKARGRIVSLEGFCGGFGICVLPSRPLWTVLCQTVERT